MLEAGVDISVLKEEEESEERNYLSRECFVNVLLSM
jgi:hypothetical protein